MRILLITCSLSICYNKNVTGPLQKHSPCFYEACSQGVHFNSIHKSLERITAISFLLVYKSFCLNGWNLMSHVKNKRRNKINFAITHNLFYRFSSGFACVSGFFKNTSSRTGFKSDLHLFITGWGGSEMFKERLLCTIRLCQKSDVTIRAT